MSDTTSTPTEISRIVYSTGDTFLYTTTDSVDVLTNTPYSLPIYVECETIGNIGLLLSSVTTPTHVISHIPSITPNVAHIVVDFFLEDYSIEISNIIMAEIELFDSSGNKLILDVNLQQFYSINSFNSTDDISYWKQLVDNTVSTREFGLANVHLTVSRGDKIFTLTVPHNTDTIKIYYNRPKWAPKLMYRVNDSKYLISVGYLNVNGITIPYEDDSSYNVVSNVPFVDVQDTISYHVISGLLSQIPKKLAVYVDETQTIMYENNIEISNTTHATPLTDYQFYVGTRSGTGEAKLVELNMGLFSQYSNTNERLTTLSSFTYDAIHSKFVSNLPQQVNIVPGGTGDFVGHPSMYGNLITFTTDTMYAQHVNTIRLLPSSASFESDSSSTITNLGILDSYTIGDEYVYLFMKNEVHHMLSRFQIGTLSTVQSSSNTLELENINIDVTDNVQIDTISTPYTVNFTLRNVSSYTTSLKFYVFMTNLS